MGSFSTLHQMIPSKKKAFEKKKKNIFGYHHFRKPPYHSDFMGLHRMTKPVLDAPRHGAEAPPEETQGLSVPSRAPAANLLGLGECCGFSVGGPGSTMAIGANHFWHIYIYIYIIYIYNIYIYYIYTIYIYIIYIQYIYYIYIYTIYILYIYR